MLQIFRKGRQKASSGAVIDFTDAICEAIAKAYDPAKHEAPIVVGHPESDKPAYGWVKSIAFVEGVLEVEPHQVEPQFAELVAEGRFKKISASFYPPGHAHNPVPESYYLRHVGFLGAEPPAVKGLRAPQFAAGDDGVLEFNDWGHETNATLWRRLREWFIEKFDLETADKVAPDYLIDSIRDAARRTEGNSGISPIYSESTVTPEEAKKLQEDNARLAAEAKAAQEAKAKAELEFAEAEKKRKADEDKRAAEAATARRAEHVAFAEQLVKGGKLLPAQKAGVVAMLDTAAAAQPVEFEEGGVKKSQPQLDFVKSFLSGLPKVVEYSEVARGKVPGDGKDARAISQAALKYQEEQAKAGYTITIAEAVEHVSAGAAA